MKESINKETVVKMKRPVPKEISTRVGQEILKAQFEPSIWARALATAQGDHEAVCAEYARLRISQLMSAQRKAFEKSAMLEQRRLNSCLGVKTVRDILNGIGKVGMVNIPRPAVPWVWMTLMVLGVAGCVSAFSRMLVGEIPETMRLLLPFLSLGCGIVVVIAMIFSSQFFSRAFVAWAWGPGIVGLSSVVCIGSMLLGTKLMIDNPFVLPSQVEVALQPADAGTEAGESADWNPADESQPSQLMPVSTRIAIAGAE